MTIQNERRCGERATVMLSATVEQRTGRAQVRLSSLSREGAAVVGAALSPYSKVTLEREGRTLESRVMWVKGRCSGLRFDQPAELETLLPRIAPRRKAIGPRQGRPGLKCAPLSQADRMLLERWGTSGTALGE